MGSGQCWTVLVPLAFFAGHHWALPMLVFTDDAGWHWYALPFFVSHHLSDSIEKNTPQILW